MYTDKISEITAHFIGYFEAITDEARMRAKFLDGKVEINQDQQLSSDDVWSPGFKSSLQLVDYTPGVKYSAGYYDIDAPHARLQRTFEDALDRLADIASRILNVPHYSTSGTGGDFEENPELYLHPGPGSVIAHISQVNLLQDDDYLDMTDGDHKPLDMTFVLERTTEYYGELEEFSPFSGFTRTDQYETLNSLAHEMNAYIGAARENGVNALGTDADLDFMVADHQISGTYINGELVEEAPKLDDLMPDRGIAKPPEEPEKSDVSLEQNDPAGNTLDVAAGANVVANIVSLVNTGVMAPTMSVMGDYHQIDAITQAYIYSDRDEIDIIFGTSENHSATAAYNIASFERSTYGTTTDDAGSADSGNGGEPAPVIFPTTWSVSYVEGDVSFVHWIEQYQFITDNDQVTVTISGSEISVLSGGNASVNLASLFGLGVQYDLIIVGGNVLDMNVISQIAVLYDNDWVRAIDEWSGNATVQASNNLIWNQASIHNVGANDRFDDMPDYMVDAVNAINDHDPAMPVGLSTDPNFAGYGGLSVLYITGNLYDVSVIKQVSVLGDADVVNHVLSEVLEHNDNATITIDTGSNAVVNIAQIIDYDSFGTTTYLAGQLYSDAILIQGGIIEHDDTQPQYMQDRLANEVIAFLDDDNPAEDSTDAVINGGHDLSWSLAHPADVMQTVVA